MIQQSYIWENHNSKNTCAPKFSAALFTIPKKWKQAKCPLRDEQIKKWYLYWWNITQAYKRVDAICSNRVEPSDYHTE